MVSHRSNEARSSGLSAFIASNFQTVGFAAPFSAASQLALRPSRGSLLFGDSRGRDQALPGFVGGIGGHSDRNAVWPVEDYKAILSARDARLRLGLGRIGNSVKRLAFPERTNRGGAEVDIKVGWIELAAGRQSLGLEDFDQRRSEHAQAILA